MCACPEPGEGGFDSFNGTATASATTPMETSAGETSSTGGTGSADTSSTSSSDDGVDVSTSSTGSEMPVCGNNEIELGEQCDDGNESELDGCTTMCTVPTCSDRLHDGDETDIDCGGSCQGCELCLGCTDTGDCAQGLACNDASVCTVQEVMSVHWVANCGGLANGETLEDLPLGSYRATALPSAGTLWLPPYEPPTTGYFYEIQCGGGVQLGMLRTPPGVRYASIAAAFAALQADSQEFDFLGGDLTCYRTDDTCPDNGGSVQFELEYLCEAE